MGSIETYKQLFVQRTDVYSVQRPRSRLYYVARERNGANKPLTDQVLRAHLKGEVTINLQSIDRQGETRWSVLDSDNGLLPIQEASASMERAGIESYIERSRAGGHLWIFWDRPIRPDHSRAMMTQHGPKLEHFPAGDIPDEDGYGLAIRAPLGVHRLSMHRYPFVNRDGEPLVPGSLVRGQIEWLGANAVRNDPRPHLTELAAAEEEERTLRESLPKKLKAAALYESPIKSWAESHDIREVVEQYVPLNKRGTGHCPWGHEHKNGDKHQSFTIFEKTQKFWCFSQRKGGNAADFVMKMEDITPREFVKRYCMPVSSGVSTHAGRDR